MAQISHKHGLLFTIKKLSNRTDCRISCRHSASTFFVYRVARATQALQELKVN